MSVLPFQLDLARYELRGGGRVIHLERQPMELLILLAERPGRLVTREEIAERFWGGSVMVDADHGINNMVRKLRLALGDDPEQPHYLETVVGKGYRLIGHLEVVGAPPATPKGPAQSRPLAVESHPSPSIHPYARPWFALLVVLAAAAGGAWWRWKQKTAAAPAAIRSIAVLPLENLSGDPGQEYFADGMTDELINELAQIGSLRVISRTSAMHFKGSRRSLSDIARELRVETVLEGSIALSGSRVRITAQLIDTLADKHLWAGRYEGQKKDVLELQDAVARDVVKQTRLHLTAQQEARLSRSRPVNPEAHEAYLRGLYCWNKRDRTNLDKAVGYFNQAIAIDPNYALPYAGIGQSYIPLTYLGYVRGIDVRPKVEAALAKALELDDTLAEAHTALGSAKHFYEYDWAGAEREFQRAIELNPGYATAHQWYAQMLGCEGRGEEALVEHNRAVELDPLSPIINAGTGHRLLRLRRYDEAVASLRNAVEMDPNLASAHWSLGLAYAQQKNSAAAIQELQKAQALFRGNALVQGGLGYAYGVSGDMAQAKAVLHHLEIQAKTQYVDPYALALVYVGLGTKDKAFEQLERAIEDREGWIGFIKGEPMLDDLRSDPRFSDLLGQLHLAH